MISLLYTSVRANLIQSQYNNWMAMAENPSDIEMILTTDVSLQQQFYQFQNLERTKLYYNTNRPNCVEGWNLAARKANGNIFVQVSDDLVPPKHWDTKIKQYLNNGEISGALAISDGLSASMKFLPHSILTRKVYNYFGYLFHDAYESMWCDNEYSDTMHNHGLVIDAMNMKFDHVQGRVNDAVAKLHNSRHGSGHNIHQFRSQNNFERWKYLVYRDQDSNSDNVYSSNLGVKLPSYHGGWNKTSSQYLELHRQSLEPRKQLFGTKSQYNDLMVLIPTIASRRPFLHILVQELNRQGIQYLIDDREGVSVGEKRNSLLSKARTPYVTFIDDDDWISADYREQIEDTITHNPGIDLILYDVLTNVNNEPPRISVLNVGAQNENRPDVYIRIPNHLMIWRRELAITEKFPAVNRGEDFAWAALVNKKVQTWARIHGILYFYEFLTTNTEAQK